ncbi:MAG: hypothetical protein JKY67_12575 [Pseudomonadales bacterium]|nr:hypothetical protein [Pseudomonadales bacterium]
MLLKVGRHIRPAPNYKLIISREEGENNFMEGYRKQFHTIRILSHPGPLALVDGAPTDHDLKYAAAIVARFSQGRDAETVEVQIDKMKEASLITNVKPMAPQDIQKSWYI